jgi:acyl-CoA reductase LuxC
MSTTPASSAIRTHGEESRGLDAARMADALARACALWRDRNYARRCDAIAAIADSAGYSVAMLDNSIDALLKPFTSDGLRLMAAKWGEPPCPPSRVDRPKTVGFIAAGNVAGAGIHEIAIALMAGARVLIKTASAEPIFFAEFARTLAEIDCDAGARVEVRHWSRDRTDLTAEFVEDCDLVVAYGDDATIESLRRPNVIGFGSRVGGALIAPDRIEPSRIDEVAHLLARDVALFEQLGCLSLHQVFVVSPDGRAARELALRMSNALEGLSELMPPARIPLHDAAAIRGVRERARWRAIGGDPVELFEGHGLEWTLIFQPRADSFKVSPGFRTVQLTAVRDFAEFRACIAPVSGRIEAMAVAGEGCEIEARAMGIPYVCAPGAMQSPPLDWRHGGGSFLDAMAGPR